jgi:integrase
MKFTDRGIVSMKPETKQYYKREAGGFTIRVLPSGLKTWLFIYTIAGKRRQMNLGEFSDDVAKGNRGEGQHVSISTARDRLTDARKVLKDGQDPQEFGFEWHKNPEREKKKAALKIAEDLENPTVKELITKYIEKHAKLKKTSWQEDERILNKDVLPIWGNRKAKDITRRDVILLIEEMQGRGNGIITNTFKIIRRMFSYAVKQELIPATPCYAFEKGEELPRPVSKERHLSESDIKSFWVDLDNCAISEDIRKILRLILVTSQRPGEVCSLHSSEIDGRWWEFTPKVTEITKEIPRKQRIYLTDTALALIGPLEVFDKKTNMMKPRGYIFKCHTDDTRSITERAVTCALRRNLLTHVVKPKTATWKKTRTKPIRKNVFVIPDDKKLDIEKFTPHDLRRTCATMLSELQFTDAVVDAVLAHLKKGEIRTYNKNKYDKEKQEALQEWELKLNSIITGVEYRTRLQREADIKAAEETDTAANDKKQLEAQIRDLQQQLFEAQKKSGSGNNVVDIKTARSKKSSMAL